MGLTPGLSDKIHRDVRGRSEGWCDALSPGVGFASGRSTHLVGPQASDGEVGERG